MEHMRHIAGHVQVSKQLLEESMDNEQTWARLERTAADYKNASAEDRAELYRALTAMHWMAE